MDEHFYNNDFERFLQQHVKHHRMYPSDAVWKGIYKQVHGYKKWPGLYFFAILIVASLTVCTLFIESAPIVQQQQVAVKALTPIYDQLNPVETTERTFRNLNKTQDQPLTPTDLPQDDIAVATTGDNETMNRPVEIAATYDEVAVTNTINTALVNTASSTIHVVPPATGTGIDQNTAGGNEVTGKKHNAMPLVSAKDEEAEKEDAVKPQANPADEYLSQHPEEVDRIVNQKIRVRPAKWELQFYIAPAMNYREIVDHKASAQQSAGPVSNNYGVSANKVIRYNPGMGIEFGIGALYRLNDKLKVKAAIQYNVRQYDIEAYSGSTELAKIALVRGGNVDTVTAISRFRTTGLYGEAQLLNKYHQVSLPVGLEYSLLNAKRFGINLGGTLQPTYTFSQSSYLLSADYKSYADGRSMLRKWNLNSSLEATFTYKARNIQWKFGPQLRYQHLPNYTDPYPIKEYMIDYGFKIGFTKAIK